MLRTVFIATALALAVSAAPAVSQTPPARCSAVPADQQGPTERQIAEATELRNRIAGVLHAHGFAPAGLLMVDVDSTWRGKVLFMDAELADSTRQAVVALVADYLKLLRRGQQYQMLVRVDGDYPAITPGRTHCRPELANGSRLSAMMQRIIALHPEYGRHPNEPLIIQAVVRMVVTRDGRVAYAEIDTPSGDTNIDPYLEAIAYELRFRPASLDDAPFDVRFRFTLTFRIR